MEPHRTTASSDGSLPDVDTLLKQHRRLVAAIENLQQAWNETGDDDLVAAPARLSGLRNCIDGLRQDLVEHFAAEEQGGYMAPVLQAAPQFAGRAAELRGEHAEFLRSLETMSAALSWAKEAPEGIHNARIQFTELVEKIRVHEHAEDSLAQAAFSRDLGDGD